MKYSRRTPWDLFIGLLVMAALGYALSRGPSDTATMRALAELDAANVQADAAFERMDRAAAALCAAEHGPGSAHVWTADQELVCHPAAAPSYPLRDGVKLARAI